MSTDQAIEAEVQSGQENGQGDHPNRRRRVRNTPPVEENPQRTLEGEVIDDPDLQVLIGEYLDNKKDAAVLVSLRNDQYDRIKSAFPRERCAGQVFHVGPYTIAPKLSEGGGQVQFDVGPRYRVTIQGPK